MNGFLVIDKPSGMSSQSLVTKVRRHLGVKKAGHTGTLDPLATGVLPIALGEATKVIGYLDEEEKIYRVRAQLGVATDTYDADGEVTNVRDATFVTREAFESELARWQGEVEQVPPLYSAIKVRGKALYRYARQGLDVAVPSRRIRLEELRLEHWDPPYFELWLRCSRGTYVRSLVHDLGEALDCGAHVVALRRLKSGPFREDQMLTLENLDQAPANLLGMIQCLEPLPSLELLEEELLPLSHGRVLERWEEEMASRVAIEKPWLLKFRKDVAAVVVFSEAGRLVFKRILPTLLKT